MVEFVLTMLYAWNSLLPRDWLCNMAGLLIKYFLWAVDRNDGNDSTTRKIAKLLSEKTEARVGLMQKRQTSNKLEAVLQVPENRQPHDFGSHELTLSLDKQTLISNMLNGLRVVCLESEDPFYLSISIDLSSGISKWVVFFFIFVALFPFVRLWTQ